MPRIEYLLNKKRMNCVVRLNTTINKIIKVNLGSVIKKLNIKII